jgi:hypothetical protein
MNDKNCSNVVKLCDTMKQVILAFASPTLQRLRGQQIDQEFRKQETRGGDNLAGRVLSDDSRDGKDGTEGRC